MATYHLDDSRPDDSGAGTSEATAKKTFRAAWALCTSPMDILRVKDNGNWYTLIPASAGEVLNTVNNLFILPYIGSSTKPKLLFKKDSANPTFFGTLTSNTNIYITGCQVRREWTGTTNTVPPFYFTNNTGTGATAYLTDCIEEDYKTDNPNTAHLGSGVIATGSSSAMIRQSVKQLHTGGRFRWHNGSSPTNSKRINCWGSVAPSQSETIGQKIGDRFIILGPPSNQGITGSTGTNPQLSSNNTYVLNTTNAAQWVVSGPTGSTNMTPAVTAFNDLWVKTGSNAAYAYSSATAYTVSGNNMMGKSVFAGFTLTNNITGLVEHLGASTTPSWTTSIFKSLDPDNANFLLIDETQTSVVSALSGQGLIPGTDIGYNIPSISGETDPTKVLNTSTVVSGLINPAKLMANDPSGHGTLALNRVSPNAGQGGTQDLPALSSVDPLDTLEGATGTMDVPALNKVAPSDTLRGAAGTMDLPSVANLRDNDSLEGVTGTLSSNDVAARAGGNIPQTDISTVYGGTYSKPSSAIVKKDEVFGAGQTGTYDPITGVWEAFSASDVVSTAAPKKQNGVLINGIQVVPAVADIRENVSSGPNGSNLGTLKVPSPSNVLDGIPTDHTVGTADVDLLANLPDPAWVESSQPAYGKNEDIVPAYTPDFADPANLLETDTSNGQTGEIPLSAVKETFGGDLPLSAIEPSQGGTSVGAESNSNLNPVDVTLNLDYLNLGVLKTGLKAGSSVVIPNSVVLFPYPYTDGEGPKIGALGAINGSGLDLVKELVDNAGVFIQSLLGASWQPLAYFKEIDKNDFNNSSQRWGLRCTTDALTNEKFGGRDTLDLTFEIKLTTDFENRDGDDIEREAELQLIAKMEAIRRQLRSTKFFKASNIRIVKDWSRSEAEKIGNNVILLTAEVTVNVDINNT